MERITYTSLCQRIHTLCNMQNHFGKFCMKKDLQRDVIRFSIPLLTMKSCEKKHSKNIRQKATYLLISVYSCKNLLFYHLQIT